MVLGDMHVVIVGCVAFCLYSAAVCPSSEVGITYGEIILVYIRVLSSWVGVFGGCFLLCGIATGGVACVRGAVWRGGH